MVETYDLEVILLSGHKFYYNVSCVAVNRYLSYFRECPDYQGAHVQLGLDSCIKRELDRKRPNWNR